jgi:hypothetical protein
LEKNYEPPRKKSHYIVSFFDKMGVYLGLNESLRLFATRESFSDFANNIKSRRSTNPMEAPGAL